MHTGVPEQLGQLVEDLELAVYATRPDDCFFRSTRLDALVAAATPDADDVPSLDPVVNACHLDDRPVLESALAELASTGKPFTLMVRLPSGDGSWSQATGRWASLPLAGAVATVGVLTVEPRRSVLDRERIEKVSHDLRTPLNAVLGYAQLLGLNDLPADQRGSVDQIIAGGRRLLGVIEGLEGSQQS